MTTYDDVAIVFEGGGMRACVSAGVVVGLLEAGLEFPFACGISAGATHTFNYASRDIERAKKSFTVFADDPNFGSWRTFIQGKGIFNAEYLYEEACMPGMPCEFNFDAFQASSTDIAISSFCVDTASPVYWGKNDMPDLATALKMARASSTMPGLMPPVDIEGHTYVDGAIGPSGGIPLEAAIAAGYERFIVVMTRSRDYVKKRGNSALYRNLFRTMPAVADALSDRWLHYNHTRERLLDLEAQGKAFLYFPNKSDISNRETNLDKLHEYYNAGYEQAHDWIIQLKKWL